MAENLPQYLVADKGVQLTGSPIHTADGGLISAQNVEFIRNFGLGGLGSRGGLARLNAAPLAGTVHQFTNLPFPLPTEQVLMVGMNAGETETWKKSLDGTAYTDLLSSALQRSVSVAKFTADVSPALHPGLFYMPQRSASYKRRFYYAGDNYTIWFPGIAVPYHAPPLVVWDGALSFELWRLPSNPTSTAGSRPWWIIDLLAADGIIYLSSFDPGGVSPNHKGRVIAFDPEDGTLALVGNRFGNGSGENTGGMPYCLFTAFGYLWAGTMGISGNPAGKLYRIQAGIDETWTEDKAEAANGGYFMAGLMFKGNLYVTMAVQAAGTARVQTRTPAGAWTDSYTAPSGGVSYTSALVEFEDALYTCWFKSGSDCLIERFDGTSWSTDKDVATDFSTTTHAPGHPFVFGGNLYWPFFAQSDVDVTGFLLKRTPAGVWSQALSGVGLRGALGFYRPDA